MTAPAPKLVEYATRLADVLDENGYELFFRADGREALILPYDVEGNTPSIVSVSLGYRPRRARVQGGPWTEVDIQVPT